MLEHNACIAQYEHLKTFSREAEALHILRKIASIVKPIMRLRGWRVGVLGEFSPTERALLGMNWNKGQKICIRLRYAGDERQFMPMEDLVDTMLHELCHIVHGPHDEAFHNLWNRLRDEHERLIRKGYTGEGFLSIGHKLGGRSIPRDEARRLARAAADQRREHPGPTYGHKLGGAPVRRGQDIRQIIAEAASRRRRVTDGCASEGTSMQREKEIIDLTGRNTIRTDAEADNQSEEAMLDAYIDLIQEEERGTYGETYVKPGMEAPAGRRDALRYGATGSMGNSQRAPKNYLPDNGHSVPVLSPTSSAKPHSTQSLRQHNLLVASHPIAAGSPSQSAIEGSWACDICTLVNPPTYLVCGACNSERSAFPSSQNVWDAPTRPQIPPVQSTNKSKGLATLIALDHKVAAQSAKPMGWTCHNCRNWMEKEWWTCAKCGTMKMRS